MTVPGWGQSAELLAAGRIDALLFTLPARNLVDIGHIASSESMT